MKIKAIGQEQDCRGAAPYRLEPLGFGASVKERNAVAVLSQFLNPLADFIAMERRIEPYAAFPRLNQSVAREAVIRAVPRSRPRRRTRIKVELSKHIKNCFWRQPMLGITDRFLV